MGEVLTGAEAEAAMLAGYHGDHAGGGLEGWSVTCPRCRHVFTVPPAPAERATEAG